MGKRSLVRLSRFAEKQLRGLPRHIVAAFHTWVVSVETDGIEVIRRIPGYHDEPLNGDRKGQRSIRLSKSYRAIYTESLSGEITLIGVLEVNKHDY